MDDLVLQWLIPTVCEHLTLSLSIRAQETFEIAELLISTTWRWSLCKGPITADTNTVSISIKKSFRVVSNSKGEGCDNTRFWSQCSQRAALTKKLWCIYCRWMMRYLHWGDYFVVLFLYSMTSLWWCEWITPCEEDLWWLFASCMQFWLQRNSYLTCEVPDVNAEMGISLYCFVVREWPQSWHRHMTFVYFGCSDSRAGSWIESGFDVRDELKVSRVSTSASVMLFHRKLISLHLDFFC